MTRSPREEFKGTARFAVERRLGDGSYGVVYQAYDRERNERVALKALRRMGQADELYNFKQEFRALADVTHPNLVVLHELLTEGPDWFFTMELVDGVDFLEYVRGRGREELDHDRTARSPARAAAESPIETDSGAAAVPPQPRASTLHDDDTVPMRPRPTPPRPHPETPIAVSLPKLQATLRQLVEGTLALHRAGRLHRDIKPSNVLVTREGRVVLLDFGMATELAREAPDGELPGETRVVGTPAYMSPEQGAGLAISPASDLYSIGVMLFEALTGKLPFTGSFIEMATQRNWFDARRASSVVSGVPDYLDAVCAGLLVRDPNERLSGEDVLRTLAAGASFRKRERRHRSSSIRSLNPFVGRSREMEDLFLAFAAVRDGHTAVVRLHGGSGMGKSTLMRRFLDELKRREPSAIVLAGRCFERESVPYKAVDNLVDALSHHLNKLPAEAALRLLPSDSVVLARLFPVLLQVEAIAGAGRKVLQIPDTRELRRRAFEALRELLRRLARTAPLVLVVDDLQWGDLDSANLIGDFLRPPEPPPLLFLAAYRTEEASTSPFLAAFLDGLAGGAGAGVVKREIELAELPKDEALELASTLLRQEGAVEAEDAETIAEEAGGSPFFITELVRFVNEADAVISSGGWPALKIESQAEGARTASGGWRSLFRAGESSSLSAAASGIPVPAPRSERAVPSLDDVIAARVRALAEDPRRLLEILAVAGRPIERGVARQAAAPLGDDRAALAILQSAHLARARGIRDQDHLETYHDRIRETVVRLLPEEILRSHHQRLALSLLASSRSDPEALAIHFQGASDPALAAVHAGDAARQAASALAFDRAARLYRWALALRAEAARAEPPTSTPGPAAKDAFGEVGTRELKIQLGDTLASAGRGAASAEVYLEAAADANAAEALELRRRAAEQLVISGRIDEGLQALRGVLVSMGMRLAETPRRALLSLLVGRLRLLLRGLSFRERDATQVTREELIRIDTCWSVAMGLGIVDTIRGADFQTRQMLLSLRAGEPYRITRALAIEVGYSASAGGRSRRRTEGLIRMTRDLLPRVSNPHALGLATMTSGIAAYLTGRFLEARRMCDEADAILRERCAGIAWERDNANLYAAMALGFLGELRELSTRLDFLMRDAAERGDLYIGTSLRTRLWHVSRLALDRPDEVLPVVRDAIDAWSKGSFLVQHFYALGAEVETLLYLGDGEAAFRLCLERADALSGSLLMRVQNIRILTHHARGRSALAAAACLRTRPGKPAAFQTAIRAASSEARKIRREHMPWGDAFALLLEAGVAALSSDHETATNKLVSAEKAFDAVDMSLYARAAARRRGQLARNLGDVTGGQAIARADAWMAQQEIRNPAKIVDVLAPGFDS